MAFDNIPQEIVEKIEKIADDMCAATLRPHTIFSFREGNIRPTESPLALMPKNAKYRALDYYLNKRLVIDHVFTREDISKTDCTYCSLHAWPGDIILCNRPYKSHNGWAYFIRYVDTDVEIGTINGNGIITHLNNINISMFLQFNSIEQRDAFILHLNVVNQINKEIEDYMNIYRKQADSMQILADGSVCKIYWILNKSYEKIYGEVRDIITPNLIKIYATNKHAVILYYIRNHILLNLERKTEIFVKELIKLLSPKFYDDLRTVHRSDIIGAYISKNNIILTNNDIQTVILNRFIFRHNIVILEKIMNEINKIPTNLLEDLLCAIPTNKYNYEFTIVMTDNISEQLLKTFHDVTTEIVSIVVNNDGTIYKKYKFNDPKNHGYAFKDLYTSKKLDAIAEFNNTNK